MSTKRKLGRMSNFVQWWQFAFLKLKKRTFYLTNSIPRCWHFYPSSLFVDINRKYKFRPKSAWQICVNINIFDLNKFSVFSYLRSVRSRKLKIFACAPGVARDLWIIQRCNLLPSYVYWNDLLDKKWKLKKCKLNFFFKKKLLHRLRTFLREKNCKTNFWKCLKSQSYKNTLFWN